MKNLEIKISVFFLSVFFFAVVLFSGVQASLLDIIQALVAVNPLEVNVIVPAEAEINKSFKVEAVAINKGEDGIKNVKAEIFLPAGLVLTQKGSVQNMGVIQGGRQKSVSWLAQGANIGVYIISVSVSGELRGEIVSANGTANVTLKAGPLSAGRPRNAFQVFFETFQRWLKL